MPDKCNTNTCAVGPKSAIGKRLRLRGCLRPTFIFRNPNNLPNQTDTPVIREHDRGKGPCDRTDRHTDRASMQLATSGSDRLVDQFDNQCKNLDGPDHPHLALPLSCSPFPNANRKAPATIPMYVGGMVFDRSFDAAGSIVTTVKPGSRGKKVENDALANPCDSSKSSSHRSDAGNTLVTSD
jgi:hypothetical protein